MSMPEPVSRVAVGVDGSPASIGALRWAAHQAELTGARLQVVVVGVTFPWSLPLPEGSAMRPPYAKKWRLREFMG